MLNVSRSAVQRATVVRDRAEPELARAVDQGSATTCRPAFVILMRILQAAKAFMGLARLLATILTLPQSRACPCGRRHGCNEIVDRFLSNHP
jgi:hypothetical protein